jgi:hypothetical protein
MRLFVLVAVAIAMIVVVALPASAASSVVMGLQTVNVAGDACADESADLTMAGGLVGCWYIDTFTPDPFDPASYTAGGTAVFSGTEHFTGCVNADGDAVCDPDEPFGTFSTTFTFTAKFDADGNEVHGRCNHPIVNGDDDFAGITGVLNFTDDVTTVPVSATYVGVVRL